MHVAAHTIKSTQFGDDTLCDDSILNNQNTNYNRPFELWLTQSSAPMNHLFIKLCARGFDYFIRFHINIFYNRLTQNCIIGNLFKSHIKESMYVNMYKKQWFHSDDSGSGSGSCGIGTFKRNKTTSKMTKDRQSRTEHDVPRIERIVCLRLEMHLETVNVKTK